MPGFWAKYGTQTTFTFPLIKRGVVDFAQSADYTPAAGDAAISKDNGTVSDTTNTPATSGGTPTRGTSLWKLTLTATELACGVATVQIVDAATKAVEDQAFSVYTYGNASAYFAGDWSDIVRLGLTSLPNVAQGNAGALLTSGTGTAQLNVASGKAPATLAPSDVSGNLPANAVQIGGFVPGSATIGTVGNLTSAPPDSAGVTTLLTRIPSTLFSGITSLAQWLGALAGKQTPNSTALTEIRATGAGSGTFDATLDSLEAIRNRGDVAWVTGGGSGSDPLTNASTSYVAGEIGYEIHWLYQRGNADEVIDTTSSPGWNIVYYVQGSTTELLRQRLLDISGNAVKLATTIVAQTKK